MSTNIKKTNTRKKTNVDKVTIDEKLINEKLSIDEKNDDNIKLVDDKHIEDNKKTDNKKETSLIDTTKRATTRECLSTVIKDKTYIVTVEKSIYDFAEEYAKTNETLFLIESIYDTKVDEIMKALEKNSNLISNLKDAENIATLSPSELNPENANVDKMKKKKEVEEFKKNDIKSSDAFVCSKCKKSKCSVTQKQTRAGDEPATTYVTCLECGHSFSFN